MESEQKTKILEKIMVLMEEIQAEEETLREVSQNKRKKSDIVELFLTTGENQVDIQTPSARAGQVTPRNVTLS